MAEIQQPDVLGNYLSNYYAAQQQQQAQQDRQRQMQRQDTQDQYAAQEHDYVAMQRKNEIIARTAMAADTPEKWQQLVPQAAQQLGWTGQLPGFDQRERILSEAMSLKDQIEQKMQEREFGLKSRQVDASIRASNASAAHSNAETQALLHPTGGAGGVNNQTFDNISSLRKEYIGATKDFGTVRDAYGRIKATGGAATPAGDIAMVYAFMKMLDPGSVVRESEFATAATAKSLLDRLGISWDAVKAAWQGTKLQPSVRSDFMRQADNLYRQNEGQYNNIRSTYGTLARNFGFDPSYVVTDQTQGLTAPPVQQPQPPAASQSGEITIRRIR